MIGFVLKKIFGTKHQREMKALFPYVQRINDLEESIKKLSDTELLAKSDEFKRRLADGETLKDIMCEAFACVREASIRTIGQRHYDVQLIGGMVLNSGKIAEMKTGEGKTLVATLPLYLNALSGKGVHLVTVNDYLAKRDSEWMGPIYAKLGMTTGVIIHGISNSQRKHSYACDITYGTNNEFGFDYLRDNMVIRFDDKVQRGHNFVIVDEVDSILIDEARTPLIISGPAEESTDKYYKIDKIIPLLKPASRGDDLKWIPGSGDYQLDEKDRVVTLSEDGISKVERLLGITNLYGNKNLDLVHHVNQALKAHTLFKKDVDYIVEDGQVIIIDEFTNRKMPGRRFSDGLHQALEAKERVPIERENQTLATITFQNYFRMYNKLSGMTGTAETEAEEFAKIYNLDVVAIPTNQSCVRIDNNDKVFITESEKIMNIVDDIEEMHKKGQPILVGTISIEKSEKLSKILKRKGIAHNVLNAKQHEKEAQIIAKAGHKGMVTVSTNMAGRGTDIKLGEGVVELGGLHIIGTERHEARRIDNQLRGRAGRQGDPGSSRFYLSFEDDLLRIFGPEKMSRRLEMLGMKGGMAIEHKWISKSIQSAQKRVEEHNFSIRKHLLEYDDVLNQQRKDIYSLRDKCLKNDNLKEEVVSMIDEVISSYILTNYEETKSLNSAQVEEIVLWLESQFSIKLILTEQEKGSFGKDEFIDLLIDLLKNAYDKREGELTPHYMRQLEQYIMLHFIDVKWKDHLYTLEALREGIGLRAYAEKNPLVEYKIEGSHLFREMTYRLKTQIIENLFKVRIHGEEEIEASPILIQSQASHAEVDQFSRQPMRNQSSDEQTQAVAYSGVERSAVSRPQAQQTIFATAQVGRNEPCPCGSGKKYKQCHGK